MDIDLDRLGRSPFLAGALGSLVALRFAPGVTWWERVTNVAAGSLCAGYFAPAIVDWLHITSGGIQSGLSFGVGLFGLSLAAALWEGIRGVAWREIIDGWVRRRG